MNEEFVTYELAVKLKEKGFDYPCVGHYFKDQLFIAHYQNAFHSDKDEAFDAPTISQVLKWLREEKNLYCLPFFEQGVDLWFYAICKPACGSEFPVFISESDYDTYEQGALAGINYVLDNLI